MTSDETRRRFFGVLFRGGPGRDAAAGRALGAKCNRTARNEITPEMLKDALALSGLTFSDEDQKAMLQARESNLTRYEEVRKTANPERRRAAVLLQRASCRE